MTALVVSIHDVAPATFERSVRILKILESRGIRASMLVIPGYWQDHGPVKNDDFARWLREAECRGHELVQHGTHHVSFRNRRGLRARIGRLIGRGCEEFWDITPEEAYERARQGRALLESIGVRPRGFISPAWLSSRGTLGALRSLGFEYSTSHTRVIDLVSSCSLRAVALSQRPGSTSTVVAALLVRFVGLMAVRSNKIVRVAIHPKDLDSNSAIWSSLATIDAARRAGMRSVTYSDVVARIRRQNPGAQTERVELRFA
ncbi:MAG: DUF2334 domain-containing protein [Actinobacteria bacterium]|jgi:predicted deacetylase|nr:DUF2334 domain-containing protein [Actinomycetota bacterium]NCZ92696.1 DUF2334 domain-containing protein [Actinomycetota bacterium]NDC44516.1 DUF2334 domain-containing protein [Actinomycetota bacterium]NDI18345.1 DUF2334 domain-containing protein [Actinomycetota bacterium]